MSKIIDPNQVAIQTGLTASLQTSKFIAAWVTKDGQVKFIINHMEKAEHALLLKVLEAQFTGALLTPK